MVIFLPRLPGQPWCRPGTVGERRACTAVTGALGTGWAVPSAARRDEHEGFDRAWCAHSPQLPDQHVQVSASLTACPGTPHWGLACGGRRGAPPSRS